MKKKNYNLIFYIVCMIFLNPCSGQVTSDSIMAGKAMRSLKRAGTLNGISLGFAVASNVEMVAIGGFPLGYDDGMNPAVNISHAVICTARLTFAVFPPINVAKARKELKPWRKSPEMANSCGKLFKYLDAAQVLTAIAPVLSLGGGIMMAFGSRVQENYNYPYDDYHTVKNPGLKTAGWIFVGAGLASSIASAILIGSAKNELGRKIGTIELTAGPAGVGMVYKFPVSPKL